MNDFDYPKEIVYGRKHLNKLVFDKKKYDFVKEVTNLFGCELNKIHNWTETKYDLFGPEMIGKDTHTEFHKEFYKKIDNGWAELTNIYDNFAQEVILPYLGLKEALLQVYPNFRVQLPENVAVVIEHYDTDKLHKHPYGEINFIVALTDMFDTNTIWTEKTCRFRDFVPLEQKAGDCTSFGGNTYSHFNKINKTGVSRVSFDFRILPLNYYSSETKLHSVTTNKHYIEGGYYKRIFNKDNMIYKSVDIWDKEKEKFNSTMQKYGVTDAWGVVDLFEKKMAEYAGSKYAVSVDNCTDALFLCLKYLKAKGTVTLPSKTWISVPCSIIQSGCKVEFEDYEWSGAYQLKPYPIWDGAVRMKRGMFKTGSYHCLSFHIRKHIPIGKGGMILTDDKDAYDWFRTVRYEGRTMSDDGVNYVLYKDDVIKSQGWNMYMTPEQAARGLELMESIKDDNPDQESSGTCKDLSKLDIYNTTSSEKIIENAFYSYDYWFNNSEHDSWDQGGEKYYVNTFYENIVMKLSDIPKEGKILILGTHNCYTFDKLCKHFGYDRCVGYDLHNPNNHPNIVIKDCMELSDDDKMDIVFCHNDLGNYATTPKLKEHGQKWAVKNIVKGGYMLSNNNFNRAKVKNIEIMEKNGFGVTQLIDLQEKYDLSKLPFERIEGYMLSKKFII